MGTILGSQCLMLELHNGNVRHNDLCIDKIDIMLYWGTCKNMKIGVCDYECTSHMDENVKSSWHAKTEDANEQIER